jgi:glycosyltransferase involved in cell wall biosynthesis
MPLVSVIINCYNGAAYLREALDSVYIQTFKDYEIIFWDNKSSDGSADIACSYGESLKYFRGEQFLPLGAARNLAVEKATGKYIALLDCDDIWREDKLEQQVKLIRSSPDLALVYSDVYLIDKEGKHKNGTYFDTVVPYSGDIFFRLLADIRNPIICSTILFDKSVFDDVGGFNPEFTIAEEYDLFLRMLRRHRASHLRLPLAKLRQYRDSYSRTNVIRMSIEKISIMESAIDTLDSSNCDQMKRLREKYCRLLLGYIWANIEGKRLIHALFAPFKLLPKYIVFSAKLNKRSLGSWPNII